MHQYIQHIRQLNKTAEEIRYMFVDRHRHNISSYRPELDSTLYTSLDDEFLRCLLRKRSREEDVYAATAAPAAIAAIAAPAATDAPAATATTAATIDVTANDNSLSSASLSAALTLISSSVESIPTHTNWVHNSYNVTARLTELRRTAVTMKEQGHKLNALQKLMLNHIYFVSNRKPKSITKFLPQQLHLHLNNLKKSAQPVVPNVVKNWTEELKNIKNDFVEQDTSFKDYITKLLRKKTLSYMNQASELENDTLISYASILNEVAASHKRWCHEEMAETMFISLFFSPIIRHTFEMLNADIFKIDIQDKHMKSCALKPDLLVSVFSESGEQFDIYSMEAKTPEAHKGDLDFIKLSNTMKIMVDELVSRGCPLSYALSFGTLLHGNTMITYEMSLANEAIYMMKEINVVPVPCSFDHLDLLLPMISSIIYVCESIKDNAEVLVGLRAEKAAHQFQRQTNWKMRQTE